MVQQQVTTWELHQQTIRTMIESEFVDQPMGRLCLSDGRLDQEVAIVGEYPGTHEIDLGIPFTGPSGVELALMLGRTMGWGDPDNKRNTSEWRQRCYITNLQKELPRGKSTMERQKQGAARQKQEERWLKILLWELDQLPNLKYVICLGSAAFTALSRGSVEMRSVGRASVPSITNWRGSIIQHADRPWLLMPTFNPAMIFREPKYRPVMMLDFSKFKRVMDHGMPDFKIEAEIYPTKDRALEFIAKLRREAKEKPIGFDIEVISGETACVGLANELHHGMCIAFRTQENYVYSEAEHIEILIALQELFNDPDVRLVAQNGNFDRYWMGYKDRVWAPRLWFDTMLAHHTLYSTLPHGLGFLVSQYTFHPFYKDEGKNWKEDGDITTFWRYNVKDVCLTLACAQQLLKELEKFGDAPFFWKHVMPLAQELPRLTVLGVKCDTTLRQEIYNELEIQVEQHRQDFLTAARAASLELSGQELNEPFNPNSRFHKAHLVYQVFGLVGPNGGTEKADKVSFDFLVEHPSTPEVARETINLLQHYTKEAKFFSTYIKADLDPDGRFRCDYKQTGVQSAPGRLSSSKTLWGAGANLQNQPERAHRMFIADPGYEFSYTDGSQAEARVVAEIWNVKGLIENFEKQKLDAGFDVHCGNAARIFKIPYDQIPKYDREPDTLVITKRFLGKRCVHGLNYRMQADKLAEVCQIPAMQAQDAYVSYHRAFPEIKAGWTETINRARKDRYLENCFGRKLRFLGVDFDRDEDALDSVIAFVPQSTIGDQVAALIYKCHTDPRWPKTAWIALNVHDALIAHNLIEDGALVRSIMKEHAEVPITLPSGREIFVPYEFKRSQPDEHGVHRWSNLVKVKTGE